MTLMTMLTLHHYQQINRNEAPYLKEWIEYHRMIGFESFLLMNDNSTDDTQCLLDEYASRGIVKRIPQDIDDNVYGRPQVLNNIVSENDRVFDVCTKYLASLPDANRTWMLTHDVDEFVWFNNSFGIDSFHDAVHKQIESNQGTPVQSLELPRLRFGSSNLQEYSKELVMDRFQQRFNHEKCPTPNNTRPAPISSRSFCVTRPNSWDHPKSLSLVTELAQVCFDPARGKRHATICHGPHRHTLNSRFNVTTEEQPSFQVRRDAKYNINDKRYLRGIGESIALMHYGTKSRHEFYDRVCSSVWNYKYFQCLKCSPEQHFDFEGTYANNYRDTRMVPLAQELKDFMKNSHHQSADGTSSCNTNPTRHSSQQEYYETCFIAGRKQAELVYREKRKRRRRRRSSIESGAFFSRLNSPLRLVQLQQKQGFGGGESND
jgi:hypothetical protein